MHGCFPRIELWTSNFCVFWPQHNLNYLDAQEMAMETKKELVPCSYDLLLVGCVCEREDKQHKQGDERSHAAFFSYMD